jgi:hypothetical protein
MRTVYYLVHVVSNRRIRYYHTLTGARIAMRLRNQHLGFVSRLGKTQEHNREYELYLVENQTVRATYCIEEDVIDTPDLLEAQ